MKLSAIVAQFPITLSIQNNLEMIDSVLEQTKAGDWVLFPEGSLSGYSPDMSFLQHIDHDELIAGLRHIQQIAEQRMINVWVGACMNVDGKWFNTAHGFTADGKTHMYRKINLANQERGTFSTGDQLPTFDVNTPDGTVKIGIQICRELRFPEQWGWLARCGAQIILHLNNAVGEDRFQSVWKSHLVSRAAETQRFVLSANNAAIKQGSPTIVVAPDGLVMGEIVSAELEILRVELDLSEASNKLLDQSRSDVVAIQSKTL
ncbi:MAG: carbon-nitrogen hydrolase family protein [Anaerolineales bacterium]|nr:carbon-nitrogen hydrolase family protein [Anaerolineales bacterium]